MSPNHRTALPCLMFFALLTVAAAPAAAQQAESDMPIVPFRVNVPDAALDDLQYRLANTRLPDQIPGTSWEYGTERGYLEELLATGAASLTGAPRKSESTGSTSSPPKSTAWTCISSTSAQPIPTRYP